MNKIKIYADFTKKMVQIFTKYSIHIYSTIIVDRSDNSTHNNCAKEGSSLYDIISLTT